MDDKTPEVTFHPDVALPDGAVIGRRRSGNEERLAVLKPLKEGAPLSGDEEIVRLKRGRGGEIVMESRGKVKGPGKFTTQAYRSNYDAIFGGKRDQGLN